MSSDEPSPLRRWVSGQIRDTRVQWADGGIRDVTFCKAVWYGREGRRRAVIFERPEPDPVDDLR